VRRDANWCAQGKHGGGKHEEGGDSRLCVPFPLRFRSVAPLLTFLPLAFPLAVSSLKVTRANAGRESEWRRAVPDESGRRALPGAGHEGAREARDAGRGPPGRAGQHRRPVRAVGGLPRRVLLHDHPARTAPRPGTRARAVSSAGNGGAQVRANPAEQKPGKGQRHPQSKRHCTSGRPLLCIERRARAVTRAGEPPAGHRGEGWHPRGMPGGNLGLGAQAPDEVHRGVPPACGTRTPLGK